MNWLRRLLAADGGSIMVMGAFALTVMMGMSGLAIEVGNGYTAKVRNQRVADMAALGAALAYRASSSSSAVATQVAKDIAVANGLPASAATVTVPATVAGQTAVQVDVSTTVPIKLASLITSAASYTVTNSAAASLGSSTTPGCVTALSSTTTSIAISGGASLTASGCTLNSNGTVGLTGGARVTAKQIVASATSAPSGTSITTTPTANNVVLKSNGASDFVKTNSQVQDALCSVNKLTGNTDSDYTGGNTACTTKLVMPTTEPATGAANWDMTWSPSANVAAYRNGGTYVVPAGTYNIGTMNIGGGITVTFAGPSTIKVDTIVVGGGSSLTIGDGDVKIGQTLSLSGGVAVTMGNGNHSFGGISIGGGSNLYVGTGNVNVSGQLNVSGGGSNALFAVSTDQTVVVGNNSAGNAINISGGSVLNFDRYGSGAATGGFSANGAITSSGGSTIVFNKAATHVINGDLSLNGSSTLGSGLYVIKGNLTNNTGGTMSGSGVTFALGGNFTLSGGTSLDLAATSTSTTTSGYGIQDVLVVTKSTSAVTLGGGTADRYSGLVYAPKAAINLSGGASLSNNGSQCLMMVVDSINLSGGASFTTNNCASQTSSTGGPVALIK